MYEYSRVARGGEFAGWGGLLWPGAAALSVDAESALNPSLVPLMPTLWQGRWAGGGVAFAGESVDPRGPALAGLPEGARLRDGIPCWRRPSGAPEAL